MKERMEGQNPNQGPPQGPTGPAPSGVGAGPEGEGLPQNPSAESNITETGVPPIFTKAFEGESEGVLNPKEQGEEQGEPIQPQQTPEQPVATQPSEVTQEITPQQAGGQGGNGGTEGGDRGGEGGGPERPGGPEGENPEFEDPKLPARQVATRLVEIYTMEAEQREQHADEYDDKCAELTVYANSDKVFKQNAAITAVKQRLEVEPLDPKKEKEVELFNPQEIDQDANLSPEEKDQLKKYLSELKKEDKEVLRRLLINLEEAETRHQECQNKVALKEREQTRFSKKGWQEQEAKLRQFEERVRRIEQEINNPVLLKRRSVLKVEVEAEVRRLEDGIKESQAQEQRELLGQSEPDSWEKVVEEEELREAKREIRREELPENLPNFSQALQLLNQQEQFKRVNDAQFNQEVYSQAKEIVGWYFQEAGSLGILFDLNQDLNSDFEQYMKGLGLKSTDPREPVRRINLSDMRDPTSGIRAISQARQARVETEPDWNDVFETGRFSQDQRRQFQGVRGEYVRRAYEQMRTSLTNLMHLKKKLELQSQLMGEEITEEEYQREMVRIPRDIQGERVYGEWNFGFETRERERIETEALMEGNKRLFDEDVFRIVLFGENRRDIEQGAEQAAEHIIRSVGTYSLDAVRQRRELLLRAIDQKIDVLQKEVGGSEEKAKDLVKHIQRVALNKLDFYILKWLADNLRMDEYSGYFEQTVMMEGLDRLKAIPTMSNGLVGLSLWYLLKEEYRLFFRPEGFKNQLNKSGAQDYLRNLLKEQLTETLMSFELDDKGEGRKGRTRTLDGLKDSLSTDQFVKNFRENTTSNPKQRLELAEQRYQKAKAEYESSKDPEALARLREARMARAFEQNRFQKAKDMVKNAVDEAVRVMDIFGESSRLGAPSIIMNNGDHISVEEVTLFYKFAILQAGKAYSKDHNGAEDNPALIRWRSRIWIGRFKRAGLDRSKASREFAAGGKDGNKLEVKLHEGWEETGLTEQEWQALKGAVAELRRNGFKAQINGVKFADIIQMPELQSVLNNFLADYKSSNTQVNDDYLRLQAFKGKLDTVKNLLLRLGLKKPIEGTNQHVLNEYTQLIENSRQFHAELTRLVYYEATHATLEKVRQTKDGRTIYEDSDFSADRIEYGWQGKPWGIGRAQHRKAFEYTNYRRTAPRAIDLVHAIPVSLNSLSQEQASDDILSMFWDLKRLEKDDEWALMTFAMRNRDAWFIGGALEGSIELDKPRGWGFLEKPLTDANSLWLEFEKLGIEWNKFIQQATNPNSYNDPVINHWREVIIKHLMETTLSRFTPIIIGTEKQLAFDRQALGSGAGYEENEKFALRFLEWLLSEKAASLEHGGREAGGWQAYEEVRDIIRFITTPDTYRKGSSIWDEVWRKLTPGHNPRLSSRAPEPTYFALAA